jgi:hypothetical protein
MVVLTAMPQRSESFSKKHTGRPTSEGGKVKKVTGALPEGRMPVSIAGKELLGRKKAQTAKKMSQESFC